MNIADFIEEAVVDISWASATQYNKLVREMTRTMVDLHNKGVYDIRELKAYSDSGMYRKRCIGDLNERGIFLSEADVSIYFEFHYKCAKEAYSIVFD